MKKGELKSAFFLAWRYFFSRKSTNAVNVIAIVAVIGIALVTLAMVVVLSVFNGFEQFTTTQFSSLSPKYIIERVDGKVFSASSVSIPNAVGVLTEQALVSYEENSSAVQIIGIEPGYTDIVPLEQFVYDGVFDVGNASHPYAVVGLGLAYELGTGVDYRIPLQITVPKRLGRLSTVMPAKNFDRRNFVVSGTFRLDRPEDAEVLFLPIETVRDMLQYSGDEVSYLALGEETNLGQLTDILTSLGSDFRMCDRYEQHPEAYRVIRIEKWISFLLLIFVLVLSLFSVISTLGMLVIEKSEDSETLRFLGASPKMIDAVIVLEGWLLSITGLTIGLVLGIILVLLQAKYGFVKLAGGESGAFLISSYPVALSISDLLWIAIIILVIGWISSRLAYRLFRRVDSSLSA